MRVIGKFFTNAPNITQYRAGGFMFELHDQSEFRAGNAHRLKVFTDDASDDPPLEIFQYHGNAARAACIEAMERFLRWR